MNKGKFADYDEIIDCAEIALEGSPWSIDIWDDGDSHYAILEAHSPAGEDIPLERNFDKDKYPELLTYHIAAWVRQERDSFDADEHVELWIHGRGENGVPGTVRELLEDADAIQQMLDDLYERLSTTIYK